MNTKNLKPFKKGQSGNPKGRPVGAKSGLRAHLHNRLSKSASPQVLNDLKILGVELDDNTNGAVIAHALIQSAQSGDISAIKFIFEQTEISLEKEEELYREQRAKERFLALPEEKRDEQRKLLASLGLDCPYDK